MFYCLCYPATFNDSKEKFTTVFCSFFRDKKSFCTTTFFKSSHKNNFLRNSCICLSWQIDAMNILYFLGKNSLISFLLHNHCFLSFQQVSHSFLFTFYWFIKKWFIVSYYFEIFDFYEWYVIFIKRISNYQA